MQNKTIAPKDNQNLKTFGGAFFLFLIIFSFNVFSSGLEYTQNGFKDLTFFDSRTFSTLFNNNYANVYGSPLLYSRVIDTNAKLQNALMNDINQDGKNEMFVINGNAITVYNTESFNVSKIISLPHIPRKMYIFNNKLIVMSSDDDDSYIYITIYDGSLNLTFSKRSSQSSIIKQNIYGDNGGIDCYNDDCALVYYSSDSHRVVTFDYFDLSDVNTTGGAISNFLAYDTAKSLTLPMPFEPIALDINKNGHIDFTINAVFGSLDFFSAEYNGSEINLLSATMEIMSCAQPLNMIAGSFNDNSDITIATGCIFNAGITMSSFYYDGSKWVVVKKRTFAGYSASSNIFACTVFPANYNPNYCMIGYRADNKIDLLGATDFGVQFGQADTLQATSPIISNYFLPTQSIEKFAFSLYANSLKSECNNNPISYGCVYLSDVLTPYGIFNINDDQIFSYFTGLASLQSAYSLTNSSYHAGVQPAYMKNSPYMDIVYQTDSNIVYMSDGFITPSATISKYNINPCTNTVWEINTTSEITITPVSYNNFYKVKARAYLYYGDTNQQGGEWSVLASSGVIFNFNFDVNKSITNGLIRLQAQDETNSSITTIDLPFSVGLTGVKFNECQTSITTSTTSTANETNPAILNNQANFTLQNNFIKTGIYEQANTLGVPVIIFFILVLVGADVVIFLWCVRYVQQLQNNISALVLFILFVDLVAVIIATMFSIISPAYLITLFVLILIIGGLMIAKFFNNSHSGG